MSLILEAHENLAQYDTVFINADGEAALSDASAAATMPVVAMCKDATILANATGEFYQIGTEITNATWSWTPGGFIYASTTAGDLTQTPPAALGEIVQIVGFAITATTMVLYPQLITIER